MTPGCKPPSAVKTEAASSAESDSVKLLTVNGLTLILRVLKENP